MKAVPRADALPEVDRYRAEHPEDVSAPATDSKQVWDRFRVSDAYRSTLLALIHAQQGLCAYCEQALVWTREDRDAAARAHLTPVTPGNRVELDSQIEHFRAKSKGDGRTLDPINLIACCSGGTASALEHFGGRYEARWSRKERNDSCGQAKCDEGIAIDPRDLPISVSLVRFGIEGNVAPDPEGCEQAGVDMAELETVLNKSLNLNCPRLKNARKPHLKKATEYVELLRLIADEIEAHPEVSNEQLMSLVKRILAPDAEGNLRSFWSVWRQAFEPVSTEWILGNLERLQFPHVSETVE